MKNEIIIIVGRKGCGKTTLAKQIIKDTSRIIILDPQGEYEIDNGLRVKSYDAFSSAVLNYRFSSNFKILYFPKMEENVWTIFNSLCKMVLKIRNLTFVIEELGNFVSSKFTLPSFETMVRLSRHEAINIIGITQRAKQIPIGFRSQADRIYTFQQIEPADLDYLKEFLDYENIKKVRELENHYFLEYYTNGKTEIKKINLP